MTAVDAVRRPEYTGANRCWPCTVLNAALLGAVAVVAGLAWLPAGVAVAAVGAAAIWLRGYLVPYTPRFAPRLVDRLPVAFKGGESGPPDAGGRSGALAGPDPSDPDAVLETLLAGGVLVADGEQVFLSAAFEDAWERERERLRDATDADLAAAAADAAPADPDVTVHHVDGGTWLRVAGEDDAYLSRPIAVAEVAAVRALADADADLDAETRATAARALRAFLDACPVCETELVESSTANCCGGRKADPRPVLLCPACDHRLYTFPEA